MLFNVIKKQKNVLPVFLLDIIVQFSIIDANCSDNLCISNLNDEIVSKNILQKKEQNNEDVSTCNNNHHHIVKTEFQNKTNDLSKMILENNNLLSIDHILELLWNSYKHIFSIHNNDSDVRIVSIHDNVIQQHINNLNEYHNILSSKRKEFKNTKNTEIMNRTNTINYIKTVPPNMRKIKLHNFLKEEIIKFSSNIKHVTNISKQHEFVNANKIIVDTYFKVQEALLYNQNEIILNIDTDYQTINKILNIFQQKVLENINSFYDCCLRGNVSYKETTCYKLDMIHNKIEELETSPKDIINILGIVNKLEVNTNSQEVIDKLKTLRSKIKELEVNDKLKDIKNDLIRLNKKIHDLILNANLRGIRSRLTETNVLKNITTIIPTTSNILGWCSENYEDWDETLSKYEKMIMNIFKYKLNNNKINKQELANTFMLLYKVANINNIIENYYYTAKLLCNLSPITKPHPIILPRSLAV